VKSSSDVKQNTVPSAARNLTFPIALLAGLLAAGASAALYVHEAGQIERGWRDREKLQVTMFAEIFGRSFQSAANNALTLANGDALQVYLSKGDPGELDRAIGRARFFVHQQRAYDQVRYLDEHGREIIHVYRGGKPAKSDGTQSDADRAYFQATQALGPGQIYISPIDLNVDSGRIETPFKPTLRFATPVFDATGRRRGVYAVNYLAATPLSRLEELDLSSAHSSRVLNSDGYWLKAADPSQEWGFMLPERSEFTMARTEPALWERMAHDSDGQVARNGGLLTWRHVVLSKVVLGDGAAATVTANPFLIVATEVSGPEWAAAFRSLRQVFSILTFILLLLVAITAWFVRAQQEARAEQDRFFTLSLDLLCIASSDGYFKRVSNAVTDVLGWSVEEFRSSPFIDFVHPDDVAATLKEVEKQVISGEKVLHFENRYRAKDGSWRVLSWRSIPYPGGLMYATARDVTEHKRSEEEIRRLNSDLRKRAEQLENANKELEAFSYSVSHDLRAPLRHIDGFAGLLAKTDGKVLSEKGLSHMAQISTSAKQMGVLIDDLLSFSRMGRTEMRMGPVDLNVLLREVIQGLPMDTHGRVIEWKIADLPVVNGDRAMIRQVLINLISNAVKYTGPRNPARIEVGCGDKGEDELIFFVRDNGVGFEMEYAHKLFGVFQRLHRSEDFEGTGIGLANVRRIVARHGGRTWAEGKPDEGATFYFSLPKQPGQQI
jgi:PAS domain S-box-containing protein